MLLLCSCHAFAMHLLCSCSAVAMQWQGNRHAIGIALLGSCYAFPIHLLYIFHSFAMHLQCICYAFTMQFPCSCHAFAICYTYAMHLLYICNAFAHAFAMHVICVCHAVACAMCLPCCCPVRQSKYPLWLEPALAKSAGCRLTSESPELCHHAPRPKHAWPSRAQDGRHESRFSSGSGDGRIFHGKTSASRERWDVPSHSPERRGINAIGFPMLGRMLSLAVASVDKMPFPNIDGMHH